MDVYGVGKKIGDLGKVCRSLGEVGKRSGVSGGHGVGWSTVGLRELGSGYIRV